jgi:hypothetical protein
MLRIKFPTIFVLNVKNLRIQMILITALTSAAQLLEYEFRDMIILTRLRTIGDRNQHVSNLTP